MRTGRLLATGIPPSTGVTSRCCTPVVSQSESLFKQVLKNAANCVLASLKPSTYERLYASGSRSLGPCWTAFLNTLRLQEILWGGIHSRNAGTDGAEHFI